jgi:hypothetical protein
MNRENRFRLNAAARRKNDGPRMKNDETIDAGAQKAKRHGDAYALPKLCEIIPIRHSSFGINSSFVIGHFLDATVRLPF